MLRVYNRMNNVQTLGPGNRYALWLQGCKRRCKGCIAPDSRPLDGGTIVPVGQIAEEILRDNSIEGVTVSGGEPFLQPEALRSLLSCIRSRRDLGVIIYTGYTLGELKNLQDPAIDEIISSLSDIIIDGEYIDELNDGKSLKGSSNQKVNFITDRYLPYRELYEQDSRNVQITIKGKEAILVGIPNRETLEAWKKVAGSPDDSKE